MAKKLLITGGSGMVGKNLLEHPEIRNYDILHPTSSNLNLLDFDQTIDYLKINKPDIIVHAAGKVGGIQANIADPIGFLIDNLEIGTNLIKASLKTGIKEFINIGSSCMYPKDATNPLKESFILKGELEPTNEGYALAKIVAARYCEYINRINTEMRYKTIIPCNLYGRHDKFGITNSHMLPAVIRKIHEAKRNDFKNVIIWGDGTGRREFMYAADLADFIFSAIPRLEDLPQYINVGPGDDLTINDFYKNVAEVIGYSGEFTHDLNKPVGMTRKLVDTTLLNSFGWKPSTSLKMGIELTYEYFKSIAND